MLISFNQIFIEILLAGIFFKFFEDIPKTFLAVLLLKCFYPKFKL